MGIFYFDIAQIRFHISRVRICEAAYQFSFKLSGSVSNENMAFLIDNDVTGKKQRSSDTEYKSIFYYARQAFPKEKLVSFCHWSNIK